jgi:type II secretory pathway component PulF
MIESGVSHQSALDLVFEHLPKRELYKKLKSIHLEENDNLIDLILKSNIYPSFAQNSIRLAYKSGNLESTLKNISHQTQSDSEKVIDKAFSRIEPIVLLFLAVGVGSVLLSLIIPLLQAMQTLGF